MNNCVWLKRNYELKIILLRGSVWWYNIQGDAMCFPDDLSLMVRINNDQMEVYPPSAIT